MSRLLVIAGLVLVALGLAWPLVQRLGLGRFPGDVLVSRGNMSLYFPIATSLILSALLTGVLWLMRR